MGQFHHLGAILGKEKSKSGVLFRNPESIDVIAMNHHLGGKAVLGPIAVGIFLGQFVREGISPGLDQVIGGDGSGHALE